MEDMNIQRIREKIYIGISEGKKVFTCSATYKAERETLLKISKQQHPKTKMYEAEITELTYIKIGKLIQQRVKR